MSGQRVYPEPPVGQVFGRLRVLVPAVAHTSGHRAALVQCACGSPPKAVPLHRLRGGAQSCGACLRVGPKPRAPHQPTGYPMGRRPVAVNRSKTAIIRVRLTKGEREATARLALANHMSIAQVLRAGLRVLLKQPGRPEGGV